MKEQAQSELRTTKSELAKPLPNSKHQGHSRSHTAERDKAVAEATAQTKRADTVTADGTRPARNATMPG